MAAKKELLFKDLPFRPGRNQVFYIESGYDREANDFIHRNYDALKKMFSRNGMEFYYLPFLLRERDVQAKVMYYAPYLSPKLLYREVESSEMAQYIADADIRRSLQPSFMFEASDGGYAERETRFQYVLFSDIDTAGDAPVESLEQLVMSAIEQHRSRLFRMFSTLTSRWRSSSSSAQSRRADAGRPEVSVSHDTAAMTGEAEDRGCCFGKGPDYSAVSPEEQSLTDTARILADLRRTVQRLRLEGVPLMAIHEFIDKHEPLSEMVITPDYCIFLPLYNDQHCRPLEIEMGALPKAIYFLFLRYPEGIVYKHIQDYYAELLNIYRQLRPNTDEARLRLTVTKVTNPLGNALNENLARIRKAFVEKFDEHLACNYIVTGERGSTYSIPLDRNLVVWQE